MQVVEMRALDAGILKFVDKAVDIVRPKRGLKCG